MVDLVTAAVVCGEELDGDDGGGGSAPRKKKDEVVGREAVSGL